MENKLKIYYPEIGDIESFKEKDMMLKIANIYEEFGYETKKYYDSVFNLFRFIITKTPKRRRIK